MDHESAAAMEVAQQEIRGKELAVSEDENKAKNIAKAHEMAGQIRTAAMLSSFTDISALVWLKQMKETKIYKQMDGIHTWEDFCNHIGMSRANIDKKILDLKTLGDDFMTAVGRLSVSYKDIRKLRMLSSEGTIEITGTTVTIGDEIIPLDADHTEDIQAALEKVVDEKDKVIEDAQAIIRTRDKEINSKRDLITKQEKAMAKLEKDLARKPKSPFSEDVEKFNLNTETLTRTLIEMTSALVESVPENATMLMKSSVLEALATIHRHVIAMHREAAERYEDPEIYDSPLDSADNFGANAVLPEDMKDFWSGLKPIQLPSATPDPDAK